MGTRGKKTQVVRIVEGFFLLIVAFALSNTAFSMTSKEKETITKVEGLIQKGQLKIAEKTLVLKLKSVKVSTESSYQLTMLLNRIYLNQQDFDKYLLNSNRALTFAKRLHPIYISEVYAHKAYYWHYMMWPDSALVYSNKAMHLFQKNRSSMAKVDVPFMYEVYAITYLYRTDAIKPQAYLDAPIPDFKRKQFQWFDSALYYHHLYPFTFSFELSRLYRSYANRWFDLVVGDRSANITPVQYLAFDKANALYDQGINCLQPWEYNDFLSLNGLKGAIHTYIRKYSEADQIFKNALKKVTKKIFSDRSKVAFQPLMVFLTFHLKNTLYLPYSQKAIDHHIGVLKSLRSDYWKSFDQQSDLPYDPYRTSPYVHLFNLHAIKSMHAGNGKADFSTAVSYLITLKSYFHYLKKWPDKSFRSLPFKHVSSIQSALKKDECYLLMQSDNDLLDGKKILITRSKVTFVNSNNSGLLNERNFDTVDFKTFQRISYQDFTKIFSDALRIFPNMKKVYISYDDKNAYEMMVKDTMASSYSNAQYLGNFINFVRVYNPITYFNGEKVISPSRMDVRFLRQKEVTKLHFMNEFFEQFESSFTYSKKPYSGDIKKGLYPSGIFHLYGHGEFTIDEEANTPAFQFRYVVSNGQKAERRLTGEFPVHRDLVVLNNCFSGYANFLVNEFNRSIPLRILSNGAKAVLVSPSKVDDYFSSEFFKEFYNNVESGMLFEDAFYKAKNDFFQKYPTMRHPQYWNAFQLIQRYKLRYIPPAPQHDFPWWILILFSADIAVTAAGALLQRCAQIHPYSSKDS